MKAVEGFEEICDRLTLHVTVMEHSVFLLVEINHANRVGNADDPSLDIVHAFLLGQLC